MYVEGIMVGQKDECCMIQKSQTHRNREKGGCHWMGNGETDVNQRVQTSSFKLNKFWGCNVQWTYIHESCKESRYKMFSPQKRKQ